MSSFKIINTTNKNDNLNEIEIEERDHSTLNRKCQSTSDNENITRNNAISIDKNKNDNNKDGFHHRSRSNVESEILVKTSQFQGEHIKDKQNLNGNGLGDIIKNNQNIIIPERKESKIPSIKNTEELFFPTQNVNEKGENQPQIFITTPYSAIHSFKHEESQNNTMLNGNLPVCLGMTTPNSPAPSSVMPVIDSDYTHSNGYITSNNNQAIYNGDNVSNQNYKVESMIKGNISENNESSQNITENDCLTQEQITEVKNHEVPSEYKTNSIIEDEFNKDKGKGKSGKHSKKKDKSKHHTSINTNTDSNEARSSSSISSSTIKKSNGPSSPSMSDTKKKKWKSFKKLFGKKSSKKSRQDTSSNSVVDDSRQNINSLTNLGINYDWNELRRRMEEENSTVCTEALSAREFADAIGIQIISSSDEEEDMNYNNDNDYSLLADVHSTTHSYYSTHRSARSSGPPLDMSIFIPPTKEEKENLNNNNNDNNNNAVNDKSLPHNAENEKTFSNVSTTTQDIIDNLGINPKRNLFGDRQSIFTNNKINFQNLPDDFFNEVFENVTVSGTSSLNNKKSTIDNNAHSLPYYPPSSGKQSKHSWFNTDDNDESGYHGDEENKIDINSMTDSKHMDQNEINGEMNDHCYKSLERKKKTPSPEPIRTDVRDKIFKDDHLEDMSPLYKYSVNLEEKSPSISIRSDDSVVQEYQKGRFTVTKENTTGSGHRVFIVTKDEEDENGDSITTVSSVSSLGKFTFRRRSSSQPASSLFTPLDSETKSISSQKKVNTSLLKFGSSIPDLANCNLDDLQHKSNSLTMSRSQVFSNNDQCSSVVSDRRKSTISLDPSLLNNNYSAFEGGHNDDCHSDHFELSENDSKLNKGKNNTLYSVESNKSSSHSNSSSSLTPQMSSLPRLAKGKKSNSRFQVTYTPSNSSVSPVLKSVPVKMVESPSSKPINPQVSRLLSDDSNPLEQSPRGLSKSYTESSEITNHSSLFFNNFSEEEKIGHNASNSSSLLSSPTTSPRVSPFTSLRQPQPLNSNINQRTVCSISSILTENGTYSNSSSPPLTGAKIGSNYEASKPISIVNNSTFDHANTAHNERLNSMDSSYFPPTPPKVQDTSSDYYNFFKYNDNYNSIFLSSFSKDKEKSEKSNNNNNKCTQNILDELNKTEDNEILTEVDKNMDLSESSSLTPYYQNTRSTSPLEKPPVVPNSPISGDESFSEITTHARKSSKASSISPTVKASIANTNTNTNSLPRKSNLGLYRSPSVSSTKSTNTNGSSRFTVIRESNEKHSPNFSASKVSKKFSNVHNSPLITPSDSLSSVSSVPSSKLKPSMVVIQGSEDKPKTNGTTKNIGRFTVTRETKIN